MNTAPVDEAEGVAALAPVSAEVLVREIGEGSLHIGGDGQGLDALKDDPIVRANAPAGGYKKHGFDTAHLSRYDGTDLLQWHGRKRDGYFHAYGKILLLTKAGKRALAKVSQP